MRSIKSIANVAVSIDPAGNRTNATLNGAAVDCQTYASALAVVQAGTITDGTHTPKLQESLDGSTGWTDVAASDLEGAFVALTAQSAQRVGYIGSRRYIRVVVTTAGATTGGMFAANVVRSNPTYAPLP